jgi:hypothetical protein
VLCSQQSKLSAALRIFMKTVFILVQNPEQQDLMSKHLLAMGYVVLPFVSVSELEASEEKPFLVIVDGSNVQDLKKVVRKMSRVPVVYMATSDRKLMHDAKKTGAYAVIEKNSASFVHLRTTLDKLVNEPFKSNWLSRLITFV